MKFRNKNKGFTLVEIMIVLAIIIIILSVVISALYDLTKNQALDKDYLSVAALLDQAKSLSLNSKSASQYGVYFGTSTVTLFKGQNYVFGNSANQIYTLNSRVNIASVNLAGSTTDRVYFDRLTGYGSASGTVSISLKDDLASARTIRVYGTGMIEYK